MMGYRAALVEVAHFRDRTVTTKQRCELCSQRSSNTSCRVLTCLACGHVHGRGRAAEC